MTSRLAGIVGAALSLGLGLVCGVAAVLLLQWWWGMLLGVVLSLLIWWSLPPRWWTRLGFSGGWLVVAGMAAVPRGAGDYLVPANVLGYAFLIWSIVLLGLSVVFPGRRTDRRISGRPA